MSRHGHLLERLGKGGCDQCGLDCIRNRYRYGKKPELESFRRCQAMEYYMPWVYGREDEPVETFFDAPVLANDYSVCTFELRNMLRWFDACYKAGTLTEEVTGLPLSKIGTREFLEKLIYSIAHRQGFGDILARGLVRSSRGHRQQPERCLSSVLPVGETDNTTSLIGSPCYTSTDGAANEPSADPWRICQTPGCSVKWTASQPYFWTCFVEIAKAFGQRRSRRCIQL
jgi:hypothetical protein